MCVGSRTLRERMSQLYAHEEYTGYTTVDDLRMTMQNLNDDAKLDD